MDEVIYTRICEKITMSEMARLLKPKKPLRQLTVSYHPLPERIEFAEEYIQLARQTAEKLYLDISIVRQAELIEVNLACDSYISKFISTKELMELMERSDYLFVEPHGILEVSDKSYDYILTFKYYTHEIGF